ncbi:peptidoglycan DD-metalloendopeptidase family protein [Candidatus Parcubacteria bacterium]|nr:peptidoglycan DD-metalloendopeptidase family protein [Candidatus Parcubacteria bacterium]
MVSLIGSSTISAQGERLTRTPTVIGSQNSQTMNLLEGHLNLNPTGLRSKELAVVDNSALVAETLAPGDIFTEGGFGGSSQISTYIVREGDTLSTIAKMFGVSVNTIAWANDIKGGRISVGQSLVILPISGVKHIVVKGDTLQSIAKRYKADLDDLLSYNGLASDTKLSVGDEVIVPDGEITTVVSNTMAGSSGSNISVSSGYYLRPVQGGRKTQGLHGHNGVDLGGLPVGSPVMAAAEGTVIVARSSGYNGGYGLYVVISHDNGTQTLYAHLSQVNVSVGEKTAKGEIVGKLGNTGKSTGPHLHFEVRGAKNPF